MADAKRDPRVEPKRGDSLAYGEPASIVVTVTHVSPRGLLDFDMTALGRTVNCMHTLEQWRATTTDMRILHTAPEEFPNDER
jgi:hypothetical protein